MIKKTRFESNQGDIVNRINAELGLSIENLHPLSVEDLGDNSEVYTAAYTDQKIVVKLLMDGRPFEMEEAAFKLFNERGIPAPRVLGVLPSKNQDKAMIIETALVGKPLSRIQENAALYADAGTTLKNIHAIKVVGFGSFEITPNGLHGTMSSWKENAEKFKIDFESLERKGFINSLERLKLEHAHEVTANAPLSEASFMHSDYSPQHVFSDGTRITGVIDVASCYAGDPHKDITNMQYFLNPAQLEAFNNAYGPMATDELIPYYVLLTAANKVAYRADRGFTDRLSEGRAILAERLKYIA